MSREGVRPAILLVAGFGDDSSMFSRLLASTLSAHFRLVPINLPGFGGLPPHRPTTLTGLADYIVAQATLERARIVIAHSVASIIASIAADRGEGIDTIISLEGNLTADDSYFSGLAMEYDSASTFRTAFLGHLDELATDKPEIRRYRKCVAGADQEALWELGCEAWRFSLSHVPGDFLLSAATAWYIYNPNNCPKATLDWLERSPMQRFQIDGATHWSSVDQPETLAALISKALAPGAVSRQ